MKEFESIIKDGCTLGGYIPIPFDVEEEYGQKRVKVLATLDGKITKGVLSKVPPLGYILILGNDILKEIRKNHGDQVQVKLEERLQNI